MKLSTKGRYAVTAIMAVAIGEQSKPVTLAEISEEQGISISYLEQIFARLRKSQIVKGTRGPGGGYCLSREPKDISIAEIVIAVEDQVRVQKPIGNGQENPRSNMINSMWDDLSQRIQSLLRAVTVADLLKGKQAGESAFGSTQQVPHLKVVPNKQSWAV